MFWSRVSHLSIWVQRIYPLCFSPTVTMGGIVSARKGPAGEPKPVLPIGRCLNHDEQKLFFFCDTCNVAICQSCTVLDHKETAGHAVVNIGDAVIARGKTLEDQLQSSHTAWTHIQRAILQIDSKLNEICAEKDGGIKKLGILHSICQASTWTMPKRGHWCHVATPCCTAKHIAG